MVMGNMIIGQNIPFQTTYNTSKTSETINIDGKLEETVWSNLPVASGFYQSFPTDSLPATDQTEFMVTYDDQFIYVAVINYSSDGGEPVIESLRRDFSWGRNENVSIYFDTFNDQSNGFTFQLTPYNVQREGLITLGGEVASDWDNKWYSSTTIQEDRWIAEMAIPFTSIRYGSAKSWGLQVLRNNLTLNERITWIQVPLQFRSSDLAYTGKLQWDQPPPKGGPNISLIPYVLYNVGSDFETDPTTTTNAPNAGFDAKIGLTNSLNLDLTVNPDFSQVEVDQQVTNLNRFEIFFPERRQFFLENQDLFAQNGFPSARPFFSRRIGIASDQNGLSRQIPILGGARLSGKLNKDWRVGALTMQTAADDQTSQPGQNYALGVVQRQLFERSNISAVFVNRQATDYDPTDTTLNTTAFNRVFGLDYNLSSADNRWEGNFFYHRSLDPEKKDSNYSSGGFLGYRVREFSVFYFQSMIGENYNAEVGFVPRTGVFNFGTGGEYNFYPQSKVVQRHGPEVSFERTTDDNFNKLDDNVNLSWGMVFMNTAYAEIGTNYNSVFLLDNFDPSNTDGEELLANQEFRWQNAYVFFRTDRRKQLNIESSINHGGFFNGTRTRLRGEINYRWQPYFVMSINSEYNRLQFPNPYNSTDFYLIGTRLDYTFTTNLFLTSFIQYNTQAENFGFNTRFQWRFKPVSDLFIVYTENMDINGFGTRNRALTVKLSYWFNI
jgi:hypothetical protein